GEMDERLRRLSDWNFLVSMTWLLGASETGEVVDRRDALIVSCGLPVPDQNWGVVKSPLRDAGRAIEAVTRYFAERDLDHRLLVRDHFEPELRPSLAAAGFTLERNTPVMVLAPIPEPIATPSNLSIRRVVGHEELVRFRETAFEGFGLPIAAARLFLTAPMLDLPTVRFYLGCVGDEPAATSALVATGEVAGVYWVATREPFRGRGFGTAMSWAALRGGLELGCRLGSLQASEAGRPVYERMGFADAGTYLRYARQAAAEG